MNEVPHNPLVEKRNAAAEKLNRRRKSASETSVKVAEGLNSYFDRLALLAAGALTFSVTLLGHPSQPHSHRFLILYTAWACLLIALGSSLVRIFANHGHRFYRVGADRAEAEVAYYDADSDVVKSMAGSIIYADSVEPFDKERELRINRENHAAWELEHRRTDKLATKLWRIAVAAEWAAVVSMFLGFSLLMSFAVYNTYFP